MSGGGKKAPKWRQSANERLLILPVFYVQRCLLAPRSHKSDRGALSSTDILIDFKTSEFALIWSRINTFDSSRLHDKGALILEDMIPEKN